MLRWLKDALLYKSRSPGDRSGKSWSENGKLTPGAKYCRTVSSVERGVAAGGICVSISGDARGLLAVIGMRLQVLLLLDRTLRTKGDVICRLERQVLLREEVLLDMSLTKVAHESVPRHNIERQHCGIGIQPHRCVQCAKLTARGQLPECRHAITN